ncbi:MAG: Crp/Fnr family transcriptional regulator [Pseudomonadota bacterium]
MHPEHDFQPLQRALRHHAEAVEIPELGSSIRTVHTLQNEATSWDDHDRDQVLHILLDGVAFRFVYLVGGRRHIDDVFGPGSICNAERIKKTEHRSNMHFKRGAKVALMDPARFSALLREAPSFAEAIERQEDARAQRLWQRVRTLISLPASHRVTILLLDLVDEFLVSDPSKDWVPLALTQEEIADMLGLTEVHVNRVLARMEQAGEVERKRGAFRLPNAPRLRQQLDYRRTTAAAHNQDAAIRGEQNL